MISVAFDIMSSYVNTKLSKKRFSCKQYLINRSSAGLFECNKACKISEYLDPSQLIFYTEIGIYHDSIFAMNYIHFHSIHIYTDIIHA